MMLILLSGCPCVYFGMFCSGLFCLLLLLASCWLAFPLEVVAVCSRVRRGPQHTHTHTHTIIPCEILSRTLTGDVPDLKAMAEWTAIDGQQTHTHTASRKSLQLTSQYFSCQMWCCLATLPLQKSLFFVFHHLFQKVKEHFSFYNTASVIFPPVTTHMYTQTTHPQMLKPRLDPWRQSLQLSQVSLITLFQDPVLYLENMSVSKVAPTPTPTPVPSRKGQEAD